MEKGIPSSISSQSASLSQAWAPGPAWHRTIPYLLYATYAFTKFTPSNSKPIEQNKKDRGNPHAVCQQAADLVAVQSYDGRVTGNSDVTRLGKGCRLIAHERGLSFSERRFVAVKRDRRSPPIDIL